MHYSLIVIYEEIKPKPFYIPMVMYEERQQLEAHNIYVCMENHCLLIISLKNCESYSYL